jgi:putative ABC transport system permease protein
MRAVTPRYFEIAGIRLIDGRAFTDRDRDSAPAVAIVNSAFARERLGGRPALGVTLTTSLVSRPISIVGLVGDVTPGGAPDRPAVYLPVDQLPIGTGALLVRIDTDREPRTVVPALVARMRAVAPGLALDRITDLAETLDAGAAVTRFNARLLSAFALLALLLAAIGLYGLTAGEVSARWRELAVRLALGATHRQALATVLRAGLVALAAGVLTGVAIAVAAARWIASLLHGVDPADPLTLALVPLLLAIVGTTAATLAAVRVLRADPAATLRRE